MVSMVPLLLSTLLVRHVVDYNDIVFAFVCYVSVGVAGFVYGVAVVVGVVMTVDVGTIPVTVGVAMYVCAVV